MEPEQQQYTQTPISPAGYINQQTSDVAALRWLSGSITQELIQSLASLGYVVDEQGRVTEVQNEDIPPLINKKGMHTILSIIQTTVNPSVVLSNISQEQCDELLNQLLVDFNCTLTANQTKWGIDRENMTTIATIVKTISVTQLNRCVGGHESEKFHTQTVEQRVQQAVGPLPNQGPITKAWSSR